VPTSSLRTPSKRGELLLLVSTAVAAITPKCPLCLFALLGATGAAGTAAAVWIPIAMIVSLLLSVIALALRARKEGRYAPAIIAAAIALVIVAGRFVFDSPAIVYLGATALFIVAIANYAMEKIRWSKWLAH
jgi:hypothetical protein